MSAACPLPPTLAYSRVESLKAQRDWKAACGHHSLAASLGISLELIRSVVKAGRAWMSPTHITEALRGLNRRFVLTSGLCTSDLCEGINRVQFEGPWLNPGVPATAAYKETHYVAHRSGWVLCTVCCPNRWIPRDDWARELSSICLPFHVTHHWFIQ